MDENGLAFWMTLAGMEEMIAVVKENSENNPPPSKMKRH